MPSQKKVRVGFGKVDITPPLPFPMGGMADRDGRLANRVRDPLFARALAFSDGKTTAVMISADLLLFVMVLRDAIEQRLRDQGVAFDGLMLTATHSHSAVGGFWDAPSAKLFLGEYDQKLFDGLVTNIAAAGKAAVDDLAAADLRFGETETSYLNYNRRHKEGAIDRTLGVLHVKRRRRDIRVVFFGAHPVVVGVRDYHAASADYPGELIKSIEAEGDHGMFVVGPVGGVNAFFPEGPMDTDVHLALLTRLMREAVDEAAANARPVKSDDVAFAVGQTKINITTPKLLPQRLGWLDTLALPLRLWARKFGRGGLRDGAATRVPVLRVGELIFTGYPADLGASVGLKTKQLITEAGLTPVVVASQTDDYVGYVHMPLEYELLEKQDKAALWMNIYENAMGFGGRQTGVHLLAAFDRALVEVQ
ncbi:MAG: neutral/alkaline non-lysosomal ceramidase N-terminal domain-containing protein [Candidatus Lernaella stagnicola]|nr:neutral/alkaline non-lysosomal ceramidase N-terminal domain-containing protein [Candidatus Lernaella stagnicola]